MVNKETEQVFAIYDILHAMPELAFREQRTAAYLAGELQAAGFAVQTGVGGTGVIGRLAGDKPGPVVMLRADMDALSHTVAGEERCVHSCGHDAHSAMVLAAAKTIQKTGLAGGELRILFQPAEETLAGALAVIAAGALADVDLVFGIHLRPAQEARMGQATPALMHGSSYIVEAEIEGLTAHGARPHLGVNAIDAAAAVVQAVNAIHLNPVVPSSAKTTKLAAGGATLNAIPPRADMAFDLRAQENEAMNQLIQKVAQAVEYGAASVGAKGASRVKSGVPAAHYSEAMVAIAREAISAVLGPDGVLEPITTPGGEDFHFFAQKHSRIKAGYIGLGCDLKPGLHHPDMVFDKNALPLGAKILTEVVRRSLNG